MAKKSRKSQTEIRKEITDKMVKALTEGTPPWRKTWACGVNSPNAGAPCNFITKRRYTGINPMILMWTAMIEGWESACWGTFDAWSRETNAHVIKGSKSTRVILYNMINATNRVTGQPELDAKGNQKKIPILKEIPVFNVDQIQAPDVASLLDGRCQEGKYGSFVRNILDSGSKDARIEKTTVEELQFMIDELVPKKMLPEKAFRVNDKKSRAQLIHDAIQAKIDKYRVIVDEDRHQEPDFNPAEDFIVATGANIKHSGPKACYKPMDDSVLLPPKGRFESISDYYETAFHELCHWAESKERVGQIEGHEYAFGELVAEIGACFLMMELGVPMSEAMLEHSQSYVKGWLERMKTDEAGAGPKFIFDAAKQASKVVDYLLTFVGKQNPVYEESTSNQPERKRAA